ncbi:MAG: ComEC/Rec2 family competence protein [Candidatus Kapabacteria bacterium]|nr:ComEC/Rec2 family competence protein [Candidatus Kapabacteria bacterium]
MEQRRPLLLPTVILAFWTVTIVQSAVPIRLLFGLSVTLYALGALGLLHRKYSVALHIFCCAIGCCLAGRLGNEIVPAVDRFEETMKARLEGRVTEIRGGSPTVRRYVICGEIDGVYLPCVRTRCIVYEHVRDTLPSMPKLGESRVVVGTIHRPDPATLPGEQNEITVCRSLGVSFIMEANTSKITESQGWLNNIRDHSSRWIVETLENNLPSRTSAIAIALTIGDRGRLDHESMKAYAASGTAHMFSVSGSHVAVILGIVIMIIGAAPSWWRVLLIAAITIFYVFICGAEPPAVRAGLMGITALIARRTERDADPMNLLCGAFIIIVCVDPQTILQPGMILSMVSVASILVIAPSWYSHIASLINHTRKWKLALVGALATNIAATIGISIPSLVYFSTTSLTSPLANFLVVPLLGLALALCVMLCFASLVGISGPVVWCTSWVIDIADTVARSAVDYSLVHVDPLWKWLIVLLFIVSMLWPLTSRTLLGAWLRIVCGVAATIVMVNIIPIRAEEDILAQRRNGVVVATRISDTLRVLIDGNTYYPNDTRLYSWAVQQTKPIRCEGRGTWGRRMSGAIRRGIVGWTHADSTRLR